MCGNVPGQPLEICSEEFVLNHLNHLKYQLHCNVIPLGMIKFGGPCERAIMFKGLADQIGLPCSLVRSVDGRILFNEIPLPTPAKKLLNF
uniref:EDR1/CTR1/ARMC3-like peptidase-like domain-containing protein n=1 Tax=Megaselia scalaris TaxID=36166 RepID=T1GA84_MEGSC